MLAVSFALAISLCGCRATPQAADSDTLRARRIEVEELYLVSRESERRFVGHLYCRNNTVWLMMEGPDQDCGIEMQAGGLEAARITLASGKLGRMELIVNHDGNAEVQLTDSKGGWSRHEVKDLLKAGSK